MGVVYVFPANKGTVAVAESYHLTSVAVVLATSPADVAAHVETGETVTVGVVQFCPE